MSTYVPRDKRDKHVPLNHAQFETSEIKSKRFLIILFTLLAGPILLVGGLIGVWVLVAWAIVLVFKFLPSLKP